MEKSNGRLLVLATSEGGPPVVHAILSQLPSGFPVPVIICQIFPSDAAAPLCNAWNKTSQISVKIVTDIATLKSGSAYVIPYGYTARIDDSSGEQRLSVVEVKTDEESDRSLVHFLTSVGKIYGNRLKFVLAGRMRKNVESLIMGVRIIADHGGVVYYVEEPGSRIVSVLERLLAKESIVEFINADELTLTLSRWTGIVKEIRYML